MHFSKVPRVKNQQTVTKQAKKIRKVDQKLIKKWSKVQSKVVKSPFGNDILGVKKVYFWVSKSAKTAFFKDPKGQKIIDSHKTGKKHQKAIQKVTKKWSKTQSKTNQKWHFQGQKVYFWVSKSIKSAIFRHGEGQNHQNRKILKTESKSIAKS